MAQLEKTEIANLQFLRFSFWQKLRPSMTPFHDVNQVTEDYPTRNAISVDKFEMSLSSIGSSSSIACMSPVDLHSKLQRDGFLRISGVVSSEDIVTLQERA